MAKVLIVDDEAGIRTVVSTMLDVDGHDVAQAQDGAEAVVMLNAARAGSQAFDLLITDLIMPGQEGLETILEVRKNHEELAVIAMSGGGRMDPTTYLNTASSMGADGVLAKPFSHDELRQAVQAALSGSAPDTGPLGSA